MRWSTTSATETRVIYFVGILNSCQESEDGIRFKDLFGEPRAAGIPVDGGRKGLPNPASCESSLGWGREVSRQAIQCWVVS